jgi:hypothetical protein
MDVLEKNNKHCSCRSELLRGLLVGRTPIGERVWDISRLIDWAIENLPIDKNKIAITGNSGGGTTSLFAGACDKRIKVVVPGSYFCTFKDSICKVYHCDCNYVPHILEYCEMYDIAGLITPRAFCVIAGKKDNIFPIYGVKKAFKKLKNIYKVIGVENKCELFIGDGGHRYYKSGSWKFISKWFKEQ